VTVADSAQIFLMRDGKVVLPRPVLGVPTKGLRVLKRSEEPLSWWQFDADPDKARELLASRGDGAFVITMAPETPAACVHCDAMP
jgi:hypothetical protein